MIKRLLIVLAVAFVIIQFVRPKRNLLGNNGNELGTQYQIPMHVQSILKRSCYDCHSNSTDYRWYFNIQPLGWWLQGHIDEGKRHLNFSEFARYPVKRQKHKLEEIIEQVEHKEMPLPVYQAMHAGARITEQERNEVISWANGLLQQLESGG